MSNLVSGMTAEFTKDIVRRTYVVVSLNTLGWADSSIDGSVPPVIVSLKDHDQL